MTNEKYPQIRERFQKLPFNVRQHLNDDWHKWMCAISLSRGEGITQDYVLRKFDQYQIEGLTYLLADPVKLPKGDLTEIVIEHESGLNKLANEANEMLIKKQINLPRLQEICEEAFVYLYGRTREEGSK